MIILPTTTDLYQQELGLNSSEMDKVNDSYVSNNTKLRIAQFKDGIHSVIDVYKQAREHCLRYKTDTFGKMVRLARDIYSYANDVEVRYHSSI